LEDFKALKLKFSELLDAEKSINERILKNLDSLVEGEK
jgi:hypothetical protein